MKALQDQCAAAQQQLVAEQRRCLTRIVDGLTPGTSELGASYEDGASLDSVAAAAEGLVRAAAQLTHTMASPADKKHQPDCSEQGKRDKAHKAPARHRLDGRGRARTQEQHQSDNTDAQELQEPGSLGVHSSHHTTECMEALAGNLARLRECLSAAVQASHVRVFTTLLLVNLEQGNKPQIHHVECCCQIKLASLALITGCANTKAERHTSDEVALYMGTGPCLLLALRTWCVVAC